jgi:hypothetical protein
MNMSTLCTSLHRACIIALTAMVANPTAQAADTTLTLACQGTVTDISMPPWLSVAFGRCYAHRQNSHGELAILR